MNTLKGNISVIIPTLKSPRLGDCVRAIRSQTAVHLIKEILVVGQQDMSDISTDENLKFIHVKDKPTSARNRNIGAQNASGEWLCFTDSDCIPDVDWIDRLLDAKSHTTLIVGGAVRLPDNASYWAKCDHLHAFRDIAAELNSHKKTLRSAATLNFIISRDLFLSVGGFDEIFSEPAGEDLELCTRLRKAGLEVMFSPDAIVEHHHSIINFSLAWYHLHRYGIAFVKFRNQHPIEIWRVWKMLARIPILGEIVSLTWIIHRAFIRFFKNGQFFKLLTYTPGIFLLDLAYSLGMLKAIREQ